jgi:hypothetical protein
MVRSASDKIAVCKHTSTLVSCIVAFQANDHGTRQSMKRFSALSVLRDGGDIIFTNVN